MSKCAYTYMYIYMYVVHRIARSSFVPPSLSHLSPKTHLHKHAYAFRSFDVRHRAHLLQYIPRPLKRLCIRGKILRLDGRLRSRKRVVKK